MEIFNYGEGNLSVEEQTYRVVKDKVNMSLEDFMNLSIDERNDWVEACRMAILLEKTNHDKMFLGYKDTDMYSEKGTFNLASATEIIKNKKKALESIERGSNVDLTVAQFILLGNDESNKLVNDTLREINLEIAKELDN